MIFINFGHPLRQEIIDEIQERSGKPIDSLLEITPQFDHEISFEDQLVDLVGRTRLSSKDWQTSEILISPPTHPLIALGLIAELHGRMGYFPSVVRLKPREGATPTIFDLAEIINLQGLRENARKQR
jgi:hypothetical protein